ncbi:MAG: hypothetical protein AAGH57_12190 [Pseudomonadota bacterium]
MSQDKKDDPADTRSREERLAAKLRENLRRRKAQSRQMRESDREDLPKNQSES